MTHRLIQKDRRGFTLVEIMIVVLIIGILLSIAVPNFIRARKKAAAKGCQANLRQFDSVKQQWAAEQKKGLTDTPATSDLIPDYLKNTPSCPSGGTYTISALNANPTCDFSTSDSEHALPN